MEIIRQYIETVFSHLPESSDICQLKEDMLANMEDKYESLLSSGMKKEEAIGVVISEFGSIDELIDELDIDLKKEKKQDRLEILSKKTMLSYIDTRRTVGMYISIGVILCALFISMLILGIEWNKVGLLVLSMLFVVSGVSLFIISGFKMNSFEYLEKGFVLSNEDREHLEKEKKDFQKSFAVSMILGVGLCIFSIVPVLMMSFTHMDEYLSVSAMLIIATSGCFFFIYSGNIQGGYTFLLEEGFSEGITLEKIEQQNFWRQFNEKFWIVIVAIYLVCGFIFGQWGVAWVIFPIAGVLSSLWNN
ncbi:MAG: permease prefix domain 1-containing protein [Vagococcus sp.]